MRYKILFILLVLGQSLFCQEKNKGISILKKHGVESTSNVTLNKNGFFLKLTEKEAKKIAKIILYNVYGRASIRKQRPFYTYRVNDLWIFSDSMKERKLGGVFTIVINSKNGSIEYLSHGR